MKGRMHGSSYRSSRAILEELAELITEPTNGIYQLDQQSPQWDRIAGEIIRRAK